MKASIFRPAPHANATRHLVRTALQCAIIWTTTLLVIPLALLQLEPALGVLHWSFTGQVPLGMGLFILFSALNVATGAVLATRGDGTPLPLECPRKLVIAGPYRWVRNPMAIAGLGQGLSVAIALGSTLVVLYVIAGIAVWQWIARPMEERDLSERFGDDYARYQRAVRCWWPRLTPYPDDRRRTS